MIVVMIVVVIVIVIAMGVGMVLMIVVVMVVGIRSEWCWLAALVANRKQHSVRVYGAPWARVAGWWTWRQQTHPAGPAATGPLQGAACPAHLISAGWYRRDR
jgi:hypothetical protein